MKLIFKFFLSITLDQINIFFFLLFFMVFFRIFKYIYIFIKFKIYFSYAKEGLRTLLLTQRILEEDLYLNWDKKYKEA
jgi:hypothetical protein